MYAPTAAQVANATTGIPSARAGLCAQDMATSRMTQVIGVSAIKFRRKASNTGSMAITARKKWMFTVLECRMRCSLWSVPSFCLSFHHAVVVMGSVDERNIEVVHSDEVSGELQVGCDMALCRVRYHNSMDHGARRRPPLMALFLSRRRCRVQQ